MKNIRKIMYNKEKDFVIVEEPLERRGSFEIIKITIYKVIKGKLKKVMESKMYKKVTTKKGSNEELISDLIKKEQRLINELNNTLLKMKEGDAQ